MDHDKRLRIISRAWGNQKGYCFFPWISGEAADKSQRIQSYNEGPAFLWPDDRNKILLHMAMHEQDDLYWCPSLFEEKRRRLEFAMDEHALWADLDTIDPNTLDEYPPTIAWETSPGHYQCLWVVAGGDVQGASWPGRENQAMTYYIGADPSGWDTTQLLRVPGWVNHKPEYRQGRESPQGRLLWSNGRTYLPDDFNDLPYIDDSSIISDIVEDEIDRVDRHDAWGRVRLKVTKHVRELVSATEAHGDRSNALWEIERELADAGCSLVEIIAIVRATVWNKFKGRSDELKRLSTEASKALAQRSDKAKKQLELEIEGRPSPINIMDAIANIPPVRWLVKDLLTEGGRGFIAGEPKSWKSWFGLDLALSVATGRPFLNEFTVREPGPVLWIQEEDYLPTIKSRFEKIYNNKLQPGIRMTTSGELEWVPTEEMGRPNLDVSVAQGFIISDPGWQSWLDEEIQGKGYKLVVLDPLLVMVGDVQDNSASEMTHKVFNPLKDLSQKHGVAIVVVHHMGKANAKFSQPRGGQRMLGSIANHSWSVDSMYVTHTKGGLIIESESKSGPKRHYKITNIRNLVWEPVVTSMDNDDDPEEAIRKAPAGGGGNGTNGHKPRKERKTKIVGVLEELGGGSHSTAMIAEAAGINLNSAYKQLVRATEKKLVVKEGTQWKLLI